ncbi:up-regulator of cell proliferation-like [Thalassophryne amazonica]|uniref:up-regulator of cell proliferation-like n=1 Tax=Thalassophryne amazonica TaxID=390379 RepID=UPI001470A174|nr:up-regulator of cell proliferation-like [Thalassophryne amazonica]XP_034020372.1 up-regulator of cell proliferation-like [Thalassophryne amazonica]
MDGTEFTDEDVGIQPHCAEESPSSSKSDNQQGHPSAKDTQLESLLENLGLKQHRKEKLTGQETQLESLLENLGLKHHRKEKLSLRTVLQIDNNTITDEPAKCLSDLPWYFLKKLLMFSVTARNVKCESACESNCDVQSRNTELNLEDLYNSPESDDALNPLDLITALFLCSDGFVQQEMALKMSMCQFSVPLLLPNCDTNQCTLMLWAMRDIVKKYRPQSLSESKGFIEERIVHSELPIISFVRLGECSMSKSEILNKLLSNSQQYHDTFVHQKMECGDAPRRISNGLTEITWYLPCGNENMDIFSEPVAIANLRGDIASLETQFSFLFHTSAAVFVFFDNLDPESSRPLLSQHKAELFLVGNLQSKSFCLDDLKKVSTELRLTNKNIILKRKQINESDFVKHLRKSIRDIVDKSKLKMQVEQMTDVAHELGILVDEDCPECQTAKKNADSITEKIQDCFNYKKDQLPLQGQIWKDLTSLEKEECRLRKVGSKDIEMYKSELLEQKNKLRKEQYSCAMSDAVTCFISAISTSDTERRFFLKWMRMNLDNLSREKQSDLREQYKKKCQNSENKEEIKEINRQLSDSSLGIEHFLREMGQIYEAAAFLSERDAAHQQVQHLPKLCAELLLDGFPLELVDGDASNIPLRWVTDILSELEKLVSPNNKMLVITVLGDQSTGKSTLLNTMFGVQFAVSSGRCTRGAFMLLIRIKENVKKLLNCDFMVIIDTEGLKSAELSQLEESYEHDNELATFIVGMSDITIINIAMENSSEMKDILQIVVHAFLRMKEVGKKPKCQFVHQNVSDVSAHEKNLRDRKLLLEQLNEMTQAAAKMEKKEGNTSFTDVMEYNPDTGNWYIPGLWNGNPPMAPVNAGYSEAVYELKKTIIQTLGGCESSANEISEFNNWMTSLWNAVKYENFIFSFRNSLMADAYMKLCTEFNKWEWEFKKHMYTWIKNAEIKIFNFGTVALKSEISDLGAFITELKTEALSELSKQEMIVDENVAKYFEQKEGHVYLVERYKQDFSNSVKSLRQETENSVFNQLREAAEIKRGNTELDRIKENHRSQLESRVLALIEKCQKKNVKMTDEELEKEFEEMWSKMLEELIFSKQNIKDVFSSVTHYLRMNLSHRGSAAQLLDQKPLRQCGTEPFKYRAEGNWNKLTNACRSVTHLKDYTTNWNQLKNFYLTVTRLKDYTKAEQKMSDRIIAACTDFVSEKKQKCRDYHDTYIQEILKIIDEKLDNEDLTFDIEYEVSLKQHICGSTAREFQSLHEKFIEENDPYRCLTQKKDKIFGDFKDVFQEQDQCQKKAEEFTEHCLKPAIEASINTSLGHDIIDEMLKCPQFSTRMFFQYEILLDLLKNERFPDYFLFIDSYEEYVKNWILEQILNHFSSRSKTSEFEDRHLQSLIRSINDSINNAKKENSDNIKKFVEEICKEFGDKLVISQDALGAFMILNNANQEQFAHWLTDCVKKMEENLQKEFKETDFQSKLRSLQINPQNELFKSVVGCGKQCPFCKSLCDASGKDHTEHWTSMHRPSGLGNCTHDDTKKLCTEMCSSLVTSKKQFHCKATNSKLYNYKCYKEIFPDWTIAADRSLKPSDYWKYILTKFNNDFAEIYLSNPADIPPAWKNITRAQAEKSLRESHNIK